MELNENQFIAGFNSGYLLAEHEPHILTTLLKQLRPVNSYISGMSFGQQEFELSHVKRHLEELKQIRQKDRDEIFKEKE